MWKTSSGKMLPTCLLMQPPGKDGTRGGQLPVSAQGFGMRAQLCVRVCVASTRLPDGHVQREDLPGGEAPSNFRAESLKWKWGRLGARAPRYARRVSPFSPPGRRSQAFTFLSSRTGDSGQQ